jgi:hypothetical protein
MRRFFPRDLKGGMPISTRGFARGVDLMAKALERMEMIGGHVEWSAHNVPRLIVDNAPDKGVYPQAWDIEIDGANVTLSNCCYMRGPVFVWVGSGTLDAAVTQADDGDTWMAAEIDTELGTVTVISGNAGDCVDAAPPAQDSVKVRIPLYILRAITDPETEEVSYSVLVDLRTCLAAVLYV